MAIRVEALGLTKPRGPRFCIAFVLALALCAAHAPGALAGPTLTPLGPPFATGERPVSLAFSPDVDGQHLLVTTNAEDDSLSVFSVSESGRLSSARATVATGARPGALAFSPDGRLLAVANALGDSVSMFSTGDGGVTPVGEPEPTGDAPTSVAFSPDGRLLAIVNSAARSLSVFEVSAVGTLTPVSAPILTEGPADSVAFSPRGGLLVTSDRQGGSLSTFSVTTDGVLSAIDTTPAPGRPIQVAFSPDGRMLTTINAGTDLDPATSVSLFAVSAAGGLTAVGTPTPTDFLAEGVAFSPDGRFLAVTGSFDLRVAMYSVSRDGDLTEVGDATVQSGPLSVAFDPRGGLLATANPGDDSVLMFSVSAGGVLTAIGAPTPTGVEPCDVRFGPGGELLATANTGGGPENGASLSVFSVAGDGRLASTGSPTPVGGRPCSLAFSPDGTLLATADGDLDRVSVFSVSPAGVLTAVGVTPLGGGDGARAHAIAFNPDGNLLAITHEDEAGGSLSTFSVSAGGTLTAVDSASAGGQAASLAFRPDGNLLAVTGHDGVSLFSVSAGGALAAVGPPTPVGDQGPSWLAFSPTGGLLAATAERAILVFSVSAAGDLTLVETGPVLGDEYKKVAFSPRGGLLVATGAESLWLFDVSATGVLTPVGSRTHFSYDSRFPVAFNPAGTLLAAADGAASTVSVYPLAPPMLDVAISSTPPEKTSSTSAAFEFEANYPSTLECRLDSAPFAPCATAESHAFAGLAEGSHAFAVRATDLLGNVEASPASHSWTVDVTAPLDAALAQPASGAAHLRASPSFEWSQTTDNLTGVDRYELWVDAVLSRTVPAASCETSCSATPEPLADGAHSWQVRAVDGAGNVAVSGSRPFSVDAAPPESFALSSPADDAATTSRRPALSWQSAVDDGIGLSSYDVVLDDQVVASGLGASATSFTPAGDLAEGVHRWHVVARDAYGNERASDTRRFTVDTTAPVAAFTAAPNPALAGRSITFDAGGSSDSGSGVARVEWDLDGDGAFETDTGAGRTVARSFTEPGTYAVLVRVSDRVGLSATARIDQRVTAAGQTGPLGVSINDGARYTRSPKVTITASWPLFASQMLVSNDGGFATAATLPLSKQTPWTLESSGAERSSRLVYVRFRRGLTTSETYIDDIILDESRPSVTSARVALSRRAAAPRLTLRARDRGLAGVASVQVTNNRRKPLAKYRPYRIKLTLVRQPGYRRLSVRKALYVRVRDRAGNVSAWRMVKRTR